MRILAVHVRGERRFPESRTNRKRFSTSSVNIVVSASGFDNLPGQIRGAKRFLKKHETELKRLWRIPGIRHATMDFGIGQRDVVVQADAFPPDLLASLGNLKIELMISTYPISRPGKSDKDILAKQLETRTELVEFKRTRTNTWRRG